jgi:hypothetical protein
MMMTDDDFERAMDSSSYTHFCLGWSRSFHSDVQQQMIRNRAMFMIVHFRQKQPEEAISKCLNTSDAFAQLAYNLV